MAEVLYHEEIGSGDWDDVEFPNGIVVTLSYWPSDNRRVPSHYLLESKVMIDRRTVVDECVAQRSKYNEHAKMIRAAIARMDQLKELNPECIPQPEA